MRAIFNDTSVAGLGHLSLAAVTACGQVQILARYNVRSGHVEVNGLDIIAADARGRSERAAASKRSEGRACTCGQLVVMINYPLQRTRCKRRAAERKR
jgi:hypothetical protein